MRSRQQTRGTAHFCDSFVNPIHCCNPLVVQTRLMAVLSSNQLHVGSSFNSKRTDCVATVSADVHVRSADCVWVERRAWCSKVLKLTQRINPALGTRCGLQGGVVSGNTNITRFPFALQGNTNGWEKGAARAFMQTVPEVEYMLEEFEKRNISHRYAHTKSEQSNAVYKQCCIRAVLYTSSAVYEQCSSAVQCVRTVQTVRRVSV